MANYVDECEQSNLFTSKHLQFSSRYLFSINDVHGNDNKYKCAKFGSLVLRKKKKNT